MNFGFRRINGEEFEIALSKSAPNEIVGAALSTEENANAYAIFADGKNIGVFRERGGFVDCFAVDSDSYRYAETAFSEAIENLYLSGAKAFTADSKLVSLCLSLPHTASADKLCYMFSAERERTYVALRCAAISDLPNLSALGFVSENRLEKLIGRHSVYVCDGFDGAVGFGIAERTGETASAISAFVDVRYRCGGVGSAIFHRLGSLCMDYAQTPIAFCDANDFACRKALDNAGFACFEKRLKFNFARR